MPETYQANVTPHIAMMCNPPDRSHERKAQDAGRVKARSVPAGGPELPTEKAFVVQLTRDTGPALEPITLVDARIEEHTRPLQAALDRLDTITGVVPRSAEQILAELGDDMSRFPTAAHAASRTGTCPGNNESAGKRKSGKTRTA
jgi:transposase